MGRLFLQRATQGEHHVKTRLIALAAATALAGSLAASPAFARDEIKIAGSSTVLPYAKIVAEQFQKANSKFKVIVESGGSGAGINQFCKGVGPEFIDIANSSRAHQIDRIRSLRRGRR